MKKCTVCMKTLRQTNIKWLRNNYPSAQWFNLARKIANFFAQLYETVLDHNKILLRLTETALKIGSDIILELT